MVGVGLIGLQATWLKKQYNFTENESQPDKVLLLAERELEIVKKLKNIIKIRLDILFFLIFISFIFLLKIIFSHF